jgi:hypothetical protein
LASGKSFFVLFYKRFRADGAIGNERNSAQSVFVNFNLSPSSLKARVGIGLNYPLLQRKYARFNWLHKLILRNPG